MSHRRGCVGQGAVTGGVQEAGARNPVRLRRIGISLAVPKSWQDRILLAIFVPRWCVSGKIARAGRVGPMGGAVYPVAMRVVAGWPGFQVPGGVRMCDSGTLSGLARDT